MDLAFPAEAGGGPDGVFVFLANGGVTFLQWPGASAGALAIGDFNNDGILDLVLNGNGLALGRGDGSFTAATLSTGTWGLPEAADFDGDGNLDFAIADERSNTLWVLRGNGDGTFTQVNGEPPLPQFSNNVTVADMNGDGKLDLVFSSFCSSPCTANTIEIFLGNGDGTFQPGFSQTVGNAPQPLAIADFNGDGRLDIAVANSDDNTITILLQTPLSAYNAFGQPPINPDGSSVFAAKRGVVPVKFTLAENGTPTCSLPPATISVTRTAGGKLGTVDVSTYLADADSGSNFRVDPTACQYVYNLAASSLGVGTYRVDISIDGIVVGNAVFAVK